MPKIILLKGLQASGKSTWAKDTVKNGGGNWARINKDDLRTMMHDGLHSRTNERTVKAARDALLVGLMEKGLNVIIDDTNLHASHATRIQQLVREFNGAKWSDKHYTYEEKTFEVDLDEAIRRDLLRPNPVGEQAIRATYRRYLLPSPPVVTHIPDAPEAIICDLDGTLAHFDHHRGPYEHLRCEDDLVDQIVKSIVEGIALQGHDVILMSGRKEEAREATERWLAVNNVPYNVLYMRADDDNRADTIVKKQLYDTWVVGRYNIKFVLDDRNSVVKMWREECGLKVLQVADGDF